VGCKRCERLEYGKSNWMEGDFTGLGLRRRRWTRTCSEAQRHWRSNFKRRERWILPARGGGNPSNYGWRCKSSSPAAALQTPASEGAARKSPKKALDLKLTLTFSMQGWDVANPNGRKAMSRIKDRFVEASRRITTAGALALLLTNGGATGQPAQSSVVVVRPERQAKTVQSKFYCNTKALTPEERARHKQLGDKLLAARKEIVETTKGYEFQFSPADISLAEIAEWVAAESKCCPFFDFHIDVEREGRLLCLRLTGEEGIKAFIRAEFKADAVQ
jgi:hypothetical protein